MATENPRVWFKSISLENVRSFGEKQTIYFTDDGTENGKAARWNVILGDNGTGKTTVLRSVYVAVTDQSEIDYLTADYSYFLRTEGVLSLIKSTLKTHEDKIHTISESSLSIYSLPYQSKISGNEEYSFNPVWEIDGEEVHGHTNFIIYGYGANRRMSDTESLGKESGNTYQSLFNDDVGLLDVEGWILRADYMALRNDSFRLRYDLITKVILTLLRGEIHELSINNVMGLPKVFFKTHYGDVRLHELSLGYKTLIAWMVDFAKGLLDRYPDSPDPLAEPAVCLVDEIDLHLHPKFQRTIIKFLTDTFPNTQFIVTAHSPLIVVAAEEKPDANIILLKRKGDQTVVVNDPVDVSNWSVDQILNSDLFGHVPTRSEPLMELRTERDMLLTKPKLTKKDNARLTELDEKIGFIPFGQDQTEIKAESIIQQLADVLRKQQQVQ